jgi:transposase-like protein
MTKEIRTIETFNARKLRRKFTDDVKKQLVAETKEEGKSIDLVAYLNYIPAYRLRAWVMEAETN